jgi:UDP-N-acetylglucosamine 2-epimerase (non-hydrolysing)
VTLVAAARPNFMKVGPVLTALRGRLDTSLVHTGQHYDPAMSQTFFEELGLPEPDINLGVGSGSHAEQTAGVMVALERELQAHPTDAVVVVGDVNSTMAASLVAAKLLVPVAHVEAGLRSRDLTMPEEVNRIVTDRLSSWLFTPSADADVNLLSEGVSEARIHLVGNVMIDTLLANLPRAAERGEIMRQRLQLDGPYGVMTLHRPANVDDERALASLLEAAGGIDPAFTVLFPVHPRTRARIERGDIRVPPNIVELEPMAYLDFIGLVSEAALVLTDSGGIQEETSVLGVPCLTIRDNTERPITCQLGTNQLIGTDPAAIVPAARLALARTWPAADIPLWDGHAGTRIADVLVRDLA